MSNIVIINDNNNFAPSIFRSLCKFVGDCFGPWYFSSAATLPQKNTSVQNNHFRFHTMTSKKMVRSYYCVNICQSPLFLGHAVCQWECPFRFCAYFKHDAHSTCTSPVHITHWHVIGCNISLTTILYPEWFVRVA